MAAPGGRFFIGAKLGQEAPHHESFEKLWELKWKKAAEMGVYPFMFGTAKDFETIVEEMKKKNMCEPYNWDEYASAFIPKGDELVHKAEAAERSGHKAMASEYYLRASAVYRIGRFPIPRSPRQKEAWVKSREAAFRGLALQEYPSHDISIPHAHGLPHEGKVVPIVYHLPIGASAVNPVPLMIIICGLDCFRSDLATWIEGWRQLGVATAVIEIPGTGDCPADPADGTSPDRVFSSLLDWVDRQDGLDSRRVCVWGFSTGGFYAIRVAHTHARRLLAVACLGGGCHYMFEPWWLDRVNQMEYPFDLANTLAFKWGYGRDVEAFKKEAMGRFSLLHDGTLYRPECARLLLVNGTDDEIFPIDDYVLALQYGPPKEVRLVPGLKHMGEPGSFVVVLKWFYNILGINRNPDSHMATLSFVPKYE